MSAPSYSGIEAGPDPYRQWALYRCGFPAIWPTLDTGPDPGEIAVIDRGDTGLNHRELAGRVTRRPAPSSSSRVAHAAAVAAVIAARRDDHERDADGRMDKWEHHQGSALTSVEYDHDKDGKADERVSFGSGGKVLSVKKVG